MSDKKTPYQILDEYRNRNDLTAVIVIGLTAVSTHFEVSDMHLGALVLSRDILSNYIQGLVAKATQVKPETT